ncbi:MAG: sensor histidine kinase [Burkholderiales bacterium]
MRRLYFRIYAAMLASLVVFALCVGLLWRTLSDTDRSWPAIEAAGQFAANLLPPATATRAEQQTALERIGAGLDMQITLFDAGRAPIASLGSALAPPPEDLARGGFQTRLHGGPGWSVRLPDGRWLKFHSGNLEHRRGGPGIAIVSLLALLFVAVAIAAYPVARRLTRRLERLQAGVETLGRADLSARVRVEGHDEVAQLAESFNRAATRIENLVGAHRMLLANASHELRTPLTRIRLGIELLRADTDPVRKVALARDIAEVDALIESILLSSRLDALTEPQVREETDLLALAAEECARYENCSAGGESAMVRGDPALLRRLLRNLLENGLHHGRAPVDVTITRDDRRAILRVRDHGSGIAESEKEAVFEPFHRARNSNTTGTGLGLSLVRKIARHHGGDARIENTGPDGMTVEVAFQAC